MCYIDGTFRKMDVAIEDGIITNMGESIETFESDNIFEAEGMHLIPGLVDPHVHLREPGFSHKETIASGSAAAAAGGYTKVFSMPNLNPVPDTVDNVELQREIIEMNSVIDVIPYASITKGQLGEGELVDFKALAPLVGGFSDDGRGVQSDKLMRKAMKEAAKVGSPIVAHCEVNDLLEGGYIHKGRYSEEHGHRGICSESEWKQVERDLKLVEETDCQYHICHMSTKESVELLRAAKAKGLKVSGETAPHYLLLTEDDLEEDGRFKMNPPLRSREDQLALLNGVLDGTIEVIATDHAPHTAEEKSRGLEGSAFGIVGIETAFPLMYTYFVRRGVMSLERLIELMSLNARRIFNLPNVEMKIGAKVELTLFDLESRYTIDPEKFISMGHSTPFAGWRVNGECKLTVMSGRASFYNNF